MKDSNRHLVILVQEIYNALVTRHIKKSKILQGARDI